MIALRDAEEDFDSTRLDRESFWRTLRELLRALAPYRALWLPACAFVLLGTAASLAEPRLLGYAIDRAIVPRDWAALRWITGLFLAVEALRVGAVIGYGYLFEWLGQRVMQDLRMRLFTHLQALPVSIYDRTPVGKLVTRVTNDVSSLADMFSAGFVSMIANLLVVVGIVGSLLYLDVRLGLVSVSVLPVLIASSVYFSRRLQKAYRSARTRLSALNAYLAESILGMRVSHLFGRESERLGRFESVNQAYADAQIDSVRVFAMFQPTITWCSGLAIALVIAYGGGLARDRAIPVGVLVACFSYVMSLFQPVREIADKWNTILSGMTSAERIFSMFEWKPELDPSLAELPVTRPEGILGRIVFENVWFAYREDRWVLRDFNLEIRAGERIGVVGHTGAGKSTLISLLLRLYEPQKGRILLDGKDLREYGLRELRAAIGIVQQDVFLFSGSIRDNISLWRDSPPAEAAAKQALARLGFPSWLEGDSVELRERGSNLSMGERQVMAFARALAADPAIWILDEATANIDSHTEAEIDRAFLAASGGRTSVMIAHRLATVREADRILVLHHGALVEQGSHRELIAADGLYARLYRYQDALEGAPAL